MSSVSNSLHSDRTDTRPEFAIALGLMPPYSSEDVKRAYLAKVKDAHPDRGGNRADFDRVQQAYEQAGEYMRFHADRRQWVAARIDQYLAVAELIEQLQSLGAEVSTTMLDWVRRSFGDFANLTESIVGIRLADSANVNQLIDVMVHHQTSLPGLKRLELPGCPVTDRLAIELRYFKGLTHLDLSGTQVTARGLVVIEWLRELRGLKIEGAPVGWWACQRLKYKLWRRRFKQTDPILHPANIR